MFESLGVSVCAALGVFVFESLGVFVCAALGLLVCAALGVSVCVALGAFVFESCCVERLCRACATAPPSEQANDQSDRFECARQTTRGRNQRY